MALGASIIMARLELGDEEQVEQIHGDGGSHPWLPCIFASQALLYSTILNSPMTEFFSRDCAAIRGHQLTSDKQLSYSFPMGQFNVTGDGFDHKLGRPREKP
jgi:hypothetical protein